VNTAFSIAVSGMQAASLRLEAAARNIANAGVEGAIPGATGIASPRPAYQPVAVEQTSLATGGVAATLRKVSPGFVTALQPTSSQADSQGMVAMPDVDMATQITDVLGAKQAFAANAQVMRVSDDMLRKLYDILDDHADRQR
jgi:flagellar basal-body rod protein FlgC